MAEEKFRMVSSEVLLCGDRFRAGPGWTVTPGGEPRPGKADAESLDAAMGDTTRPGRAPRQAGECQAV